MATARDFSSYVAPFARDGVVLVEGLLGADEMRLVDAAADWKQSNPDVGSEEIYPDVRYSLGTSITHPAFAALLRDSAMADLARALFGGTDVWYENDQLWLKDGGARGTRRTAWHQDAAYDPFAGSKTIVLWVPLNDRPATNVLEVVRGSHRGPVYNGTRFDPADDTAPTYDDPTLPRLPDIEANRAAWDIFSTPMRRGDALVFHHAALHGGAPVPAGQVWRSMTFRLIGDDVLFRPRARRVSSGSAEFREQTLSPGMEGLSPGDPIVSGGYFRRVRPWID